MNSTIYERGLMICVVLACVAALPLYLYGKRTLGLKREGAYLFLVVTLLGSFGAVLYKAEYFIPHNEYVLGDETLVWRGIAATVLVLAGLPLLLKLYKAWICGEMTGQERTPGAPGFRAWLSPVNCFLALVAAICMMQLFGYSLPAVLSLAVFVLLAYPTINTLSQPEQSAPAANGSGDLRPEREKVLGMLEAGKITAEESAELLNALRSISDEARARAATRPALRGAMMTGAGLVVIGFFLPWFSVNLGQEMQRISGALSGQLSQFGMGAIPPQNPQTPDMMPNLDGTTLNVTGGDVKHGMGWMILILSAGVALLPMFAQHFDDDMRRKTEMIAVVAGAFLLVYLGATNWRYINIGFVLVLAGYALQGADLIKRLSGQHAMDGLMNKHA